MLKLFILGKCLKLTILIPRIIAVCFRSLYMGKTDCYLVNQIKESTRKPYLDIQFVIAKLNFEFQST